MTSAATTWTTRSEDWPDWRKGSEPFVTKPRHKKNYLTVSRKTNDLAKFVFFVGYSTFLFPPLFVVWAALGLMAGTFYFAYGLWRFWSAVCGASRSVLREVRS